MSRIRLLPENVANQIAAGEVVERPASVVKELVENALDAQPTKITVEIQAGGRSLIRVSDDGIGMNRDDALLCLERHATSKIRSIDDLSRLDTMGFRGEALPSIASVSRMVLTTRERKSAAPEGTQVIINGGKMAEVRAAGAAEGTIVEVRQLFFNVPARRKFLRSEETESSHIQHYLMVVGLAHPHLALTFIKDGRTVWQLPAVRPGQDPFSSLSERMHQFIGGDTAWVRVDFSTQIPKRGDWEQESDAAAEGKGPFRVWGLIGAPGVSRSTRDGQNIFVNRRPVENRGINYALLEGYHTALMKGRYPLCCLFVEIDPSLVDVNIHPAKREVKFHKELMIRRLVTDAVRQALLAYAIPSDSGRAPVTSASIMGEETSTADVSVMQETPAQTVRSAWRPTLNLRPESPAAPAPQAELPIPFLPAPTPAPSNGLPILARPLKLIGVIGKLYVVYESDKGIVLMDQHAAHERILFEEMLRRLQTGDVASQRLLLPETIELPLREADFARSQLAELNRLGISLNEFGDRTFLLDALPAIVKSSDPKRFLLDVLDALQRAGETINALRLGEDVVAKTVCRHAVKANDHLNEEELEKLVENLRACQMPYTCPHGRPTVIEMSYSDLEKRFGRVQ